MIILKFYFFLIRILQNCSHVSTTVWFHYFDFNKMLGEKDRWEPHNDVAYCFENNSERSTLQNTNCTAIYLPFLKPFMKD